jgi:cysteine-rich repeat protein
MKKRGIGVLFVLVIVAVLVLGILMFGGFTKSGFEKVQSLGEDVALQPGQYSLSLDKFYGFESGEQGWTFTGKDSDRTDKRSAIGDDDNDPKGSGKWSAHIQNDGDGAEMWQEFDFREYDVASIDFYYYPVGLESGEYIMLKCDGNEVWRFTDGDAEEKQWHHPEFFITKDDCDFDDSVELRFDPDFSWYTDDIYIDGIGIWKGVDRDGGVVCGDGVINGGEQCDDGNTEDGDGCDHKCLLESGGGGGGGSGGGGGGGGVNETNHTEDDLGLTFIYPSSQVISSSVDLIYVEIETDEEAMCDFTGKVCDGDDCRVINYRRCNKCASDESYDSHDSMWGNSAGWEYEIIASCTNEDGESQTESKTFTSAGEISDDTTPPVITMFSPDDGEEENSKTRLIYEVNELARCSRSTSYDSGGSGAGSGGPLSSDYFQYYDGDLDLSVTGATYTVSVTCEDLNGNSATEKAVFEVVPLIGSGNSFDEIEFSGFENGNGGWTFTGKYAERSDYISFVDDDSKERSGKWSAHIENDGSRAEMFKEFDFNLYSRIGVSFYIYPKGLERNEFIILECDGNEVWRFTDGDFPEKEWTHIEMSINTDDCDFDDSVELRFDPDFSWYTDDIYIDGINIWGWY